MKMDHVLLIKCVEQERNSRSDGWKVASALVSGYYCKLP